MTGREFREVDHDLLAEPLEAALGCGKVGAEPPLVRAGGKLGREVERHREAHRLARAPRVLGRAEGGVERWGAEGALRGREVCVPRREGEA